MFGGIGEKSYLRRVYTFGLLQRETNMMLGMNAPKTLVKGEFAKAVRKAVRDSVEAIRNGKVSEPKNQKFNFDWRI